MDISRTVILGNSGAGKSWLAERLAARLGTAWIDLDTLHWLPGGYGAARPREQAIDLLRQATRERRWVVEGIYGSLAATVLAQASALVWVCLDEAACLDNIRARGVRGHGDAASHTALLDWAASYRARQGSSSHAGHAAIFARHGADKIVLHSRQDVTAFAARI